MIREKSGEKKTKYVEIVPCVRNCYAARINSKKIPRALKLASIIFHMRDKSIILANPPKQYEKVNDIFNIYRLEEQ